MPKNKECCGRNRLTDYLKVYISYHQYFLVKTMAKEAKNEEASPEQPKEDVKPQKEQPEEDAKPAKPEKPAKPAAPSKPEAPEKPTKPRVQQIIRIAETDLDGSKTVPVAIRKVRGVSFMMSNALGKICPFSEKRVGDLSEAERGELEDLITNPAKHGILSWSFNRKRDPETGEDSHLAVSKLELTHKMDINRMKKIKTYSGVRHIHGLPVRGQRTRSSFRKGKSMGVSRKRG